ncbi:hypothetical protein TEA_004037 [Camellia sinensis var. sinensis]|uniref:CRAL-TRIO domain-containing protein n=1 Tax=Camellia sinensis var. sinensis TaxID=542762 RepID=A0A4S4ERD1_CAMSN|nr:hypothetical protein TEA_004037 [Camellia sinensis var. sinensis]
MGDSLCLFCSRKKLEPKVIITTKNQPADSLSKGFSQKTLQGVTSTKHGLIGNGVVGDIGLFIVKTAALEIVRRYTCAKCPVVWRRLQALQVLCYPPFKWIERWTPFKALVKYMQSLSKPLLVLTIATVFSDQPACTTKKVDSSHDSQTYSESQQETSSQLPTSDSRSCDAVPESLSTENWLQQFHKELEKLGITLPERLNDDELHRFYTAANGEFSRLLSSIKKTIHWRQTFTFLSPQELESWSHLVFWHGYDVQLRPCLIIRLVSQVEHGVMHLVNVKNPQITVLMDCEGLSPSGFPMQMLRSCALLLQDHYPNRLGYLIIIQLPTVAQVITQTLFQVMRPTTQQKFRIVGENYQKVLWEYLQALPSFLGGKYYCLKCSDQVVTHNMNEEIVLMRASGRLANNENVPSPASRHLTGNRVNQGSDQIMRIVIISILMMCIFIAFVLAKQYPDYLSLLKWHSGP